MLVTWCATLKVRYASAKSGLSITRVPYLRAGMRLNLTAFNRLIQRQGERRNGTPTLRPKGPLMSGAQAADLG
jgi:hypothetical protein